MHIDYSQYPSISEAKKMIFGQYFKVIGGGIKTVIIDVAHNISSDESSVNVIHESKTITTNIAVKF